MCEVCVVPALSTGVGSSAQTAVLRTLWTGTSKVTGAVMIVTVRALGLACAVRRQVHSLRTFQAHVPATALGAGTVAVPADASSVLSTFMKESIRADWHTVAIKQMQGVVTLGAQGGRLALVTVRLTGWTSSACWIAA